MQKVYTLWYSQCCFYYWQDCLEVKLPVLHLLSRFWFTPVMGNLAPVEM